MSPSASKPASIFASLEPAPPDAILGLTEAFKKDPNPEKINLGVGVYKDAAGDTPILESVKAAERRLLESETTKGYLPIDGPPEYGRAVQRLLFGEGHDIVTQQRAATAQTPGGTGALRVVADYLHKMHPGSTIWVSDPTWANHPQVFDAAGVAQQSYPYFDAQRNALDFDGMNAALDGIPAGDVVLLHACCHNPTGVDPTPEQWEKVADRCAERGILPLVDFAYQGFGTGLDEDAAGLRILAAKVPALLVASSFSKNFGLYNERTGALTVVASNRHEADTAMSHVKKAIRANYSNPPAHGGKIVTTILDDNSLRMQWLDELAAMRGRINGMRKLFVETLAQKGAKGDFSFIERQSGMFSFSGLTKEQVQTLREKHAIYIVGSGRINVAGMTESNMDRLCGAIAGVL